MKALLNGILLFWAVHAAFAGFAHAGAEAAAGYIGAFIRLGLTEQAALITFQIAGFVQFAAAVFFAAALTVNLFDRRGHLPATLPAGVGAGLLVLVMTLDVCVASLSGRTGDPALYAILAALVASMACLHLVRQPATVDVADFDLLPQEDFPAERAELAANVATLIPFPEGGRRP